MLHERNYVMYLVYIYIYPAYGFVAELGHFVKKYIVTDVKNDLEAKKKAIEKAKLGIDEMTEKIVEKKTRVIELVNNDGIIAL